MLHNTDESKALDQLPEALKSYYQHPAQEGEEAQRLPYVKYGFWERGFRYVMMGIFASLPIVGWMILARSLLVKEGEVGLIWNDGKPELLGPGRHALLNPFTTEFVKVVKLNDPAITLGPLQIITVPTGQLGQAFDSKTGEYKLLTPGRHVINSSTLQFQKLINLDDKEISIGALKLVRVEVGDVGIVYRNNQGKGELDIIEPGIHLISPPDRFDKFVSTKNQILEIPSDTLFETSDPVPVSIQAYVPYRIASPKKVYTIVADVIKYIRDLAIATLSGIMKNSTFAEIGQSSRIAYHNREKERGAVGERKDVGNETSASDFSDPNAPLFSFQNKVHDQFMEQVHDKTLTETGIEIQNIRIETLTIADEKLAHEMSSTALVAAQTNAKRANLDAQNLIAQSEASQRAKLKAIEADAEAYAMETKAAAAAKAMLVEADAKSKATVMQAQAAQESAKLKQSIPLAVQLAVIEAQAKAIGPNAKILTLPAGVPGLQAFSMFAGTGNGSSVIDVVPSATARLD